VIAGSAPSSGHGASGLRDFWLDGLGNVVTVPVVAFG